MDIEGLYRRYGDMVYSRCRLLLRNEADAQETMQEVFLRVWRYRDRFRGDSSPVTYLYRVATTTCLNRLRTQRRHPEEIVAELPVGASLRGDHEEAFTQASSRQILSRVLQEEDERTVLCLVYHHLDGMTHDEVAGLLGISASAVRKRLGVFRARLAEARAEPTSAVATLFAEDEP